MDKSGLFFCSIGLIVIVFNANQNTASYNWLNMLIGGIILIAGVLLYRRGLKTEKKKMKEGN